MIWNDEFDGTTLDLDKWSHEVNCYGGGNNELQCYTKRPENVRIENGTLILEAKREPGYTGVEDSECSMPGSCVGPKDYTAGRIRTFPNGSWLYGKFEMRAKLPKGKHLWPAFWMLPTDSVYGTWAASGEIDIMEARGQLPSEIMGTLHYSSQWPNNRFNSSGAIAFEGIDFSEEYHVFGLEWEVDWIRWYLDDQLFYKQYLNKNWWEGVGTNPYTKNRQPWDQEFHVILNLAIGGGFFNGMGELSPEEASAWEIPRMTVDWVRIYNDNNATNEIPPNPIMVDEDASVSGSATGPTEDSLNVGSGSDSFLRFNLEDIKSDERITVALLDLKVKSIEPSTGVPVNISIGIVSSWWSENTITYEGRPTSVLVRYALVEGDSIEIDLTDSANEALGRDDRLQLRLYQDDASAPMISFYSSESGSENAPVLKVGTESRATETTV